MRRNTAIVITDYVDIHGEILEPYKDLEVLTDIMSVNKLPFLLSITRGTKLTTVEFISSKNDVALVTPINK